MPRDLELRLIDAPVPSGEIAVKDLAALATALQDLSTRIGREVVNTAGPGRSMQFMEEFAQLRLKAVESGSTVLKFSRGPSDRLEIDLPEHRLADDRFWELVEAIRQDVRPEWATDLIAESAAKLVRALSDAAPRASLGDAAHPPVEIESRLIHVETWSSKFAEAESQAEAKGRLEKVDLRSHEFRVRDDVGQSVDLKHVADDAEVARFVGQWVVANGAGILKSGRLVALDNASVALVDDPAREIANDRVLTIDEILASASGPDPDDGINLTDEEFAAFLEAARG